MEKIGYILLGAVALSWIIVVLVGIVAAFPYGIIGLVLIAGIGFLFAKVISDRLKNKEDDYYSNNIHK